MLFGVADGVGGLPGGAEAAQLAVEEVSGVLHTSPIDGLPDLNVAVQQANRMVAALGQQISPSMGMPTVFRRPPIGSVVSSLSVG